MLHSIGHFEIILPFSSPQYLRSSSHFAYLAFHLLQQLASKAIIIRLDLSISVTSLANPLISSLECVHLISFEMAFPLPPVSNFDYTADLPKSGWTKKYVRETLYTQDAKVVDELFDAAWQIVVARNLTNKAYKRVANPVVQKNADRAAAGSALADQFRPRIQVQGHPNFADRVCKGVVTYMGGSGKLIDVSANLQRQ